VNLNTEHYKNAVATPHTLDASQQKVQMAKLTEPLSFKEAGTSWA
jgi:hypothetical protein